MQDKIVDLLRSTGREGMEEENVKFLTRRLDDISIELTFAVQRIRDLKDIAIRDGKIIETLNKTIESLSIRLVEE